MKKKILLGCGWIAFLGMILWMDQWKSQEELLLELGQIKREDYGNPSKSVSIWVEGIGEEAIPLEMVVGARSYTEEEAHEIFETMMETLPQEICGENDSLFAIKTDLHLPKTIGSYGVMLSWEIEENPWMNHKGEVMAYPTQDTWLDLMVTLSHDEYEYTYLIPICIGEQLPTKEEQRFDSFYHQIEIEEELQKSEAIFSLPLTYEGKNLTYLLEKDSNIGTLLFIGVLVVGLGIASEKEKKIQKQKKREQELLLDYAEIISKLLVYIGAGMTVGIAWERLVLDYQVGLEKGQFMRAAYEEMSQTYYEMKRGVSESKAFREFGKRCKLQPYLKLSTLLEQNRKTGVKNLRELLQIESIDAWEQRKNLARRLGEEAVTKLLVPLFMMLIVVMIMIMVPAMMTMY